MKSLIGSIRRFLVDEDGPTAVEYAFMLALIIVICIAAINSVGNQTSTVFSEMGDRFHTTTGS